MAMMAGRWAEMTEARETADAELAQDEQIHAAAARVETAQRRWQRLMHGDLRDILAQAIRAEHIRQTEACLATARRLQAEQQEVQRLQHVSTAHGAEQSVQQREGYARGQPYGIGACAHHARTS